MQPNNNAPRLFRVACYILQVHKETKVCKAYNLRTRAVPIQFCRRDPRKYAHIMVIMKYFTLGLYTAMVATVLLALVIFLIISRFIPPRPFYSTTLIQQLENTTRGTSSPEHNLKKDQRS
jgi:hypothetical protein